MYVASKKGIYSIGIEGDAEGGVEGGGNGGFGGVIGAEGDVGDAGRVHARPRDGAVDLESGLEVEDGAILGEACHDHRRGELDGGIFRQVIVGGRGQGATTFGEGVGNVMGGIGFVSFAAHLLLRFVWEVEKIWESATPTLVVCSYY